jgi:hypothetical protein
MGTKTAAARAPGVAPSRRGENRLLAEDRAVHDWYRFVLSFPPHFVPPDRISPEELETYRSCGE